MTPVSLLGLPTDRNSSYLRGPAKAPAAVRALMRAGMSNLTSETGVDLGDPAVLRDRGDVALDETPRDFERIAKAARGAFAVGAALFLGGDHSVTWPILEGLRRAGHAAPHLLHFDAHPDLYADFDGNPYSHASPMARVMEAGLARSLTQVGVRTLNAPQQAQAERYGVKIVAPWDLADVAASLPVGLTYVSIDLDALDPAFAPGVSHHEPGGLTVRELLGVLRAASCRVVGGDVVEYNPDRDTQGVTAAVALKLLKELVARIAA